MYKEMVFDPSDVVTMIKGRHVLHFGGEFLINRADSTAWGNINPGGFNFNGNYTSPGGGPTASYDGMSYADFLLGQSRAGALESRRNSPDAGRPRRCSYRTTSK